MNKINFKLPKISFIISSFNYEHYILDCLNSVLNQSYPNFEVIITDDFSQDNSVNKIEEFIKNYIGDKRIKLVKNEQNLGQLGAILKGIEQAEGEFIACIDSDDVIMPDYAMSQMILHLKKQVALSVCDMSEIDGNNNLLSVNSLQNPQLDVNLVKFCNEKFQELDIEYEIQELHQKREFFGGWWWAPMSCGVFRKNSVMPLLKLQNIGHWKTSADKFIFNFLHLIGGSIKIKKPLVAYRRHDRNAGEYTGIMGNIRYNSQATTRQYFINEINLYKDTLKLLLDNSEYFKNIFSLKNIIICCLK